MMKKLQPLLETYSHNYYMQGTESAFDNIVVKKRHCSKRLPAWKNDTIQLLYFIKGEGTLWVNGLEIRIKPGVIARLFPYHISVLEADTEEGVEFYHCDFPLSILMYQDVKKRFNNTEYSVVESGNFAFAVSEKDARRVEDALAEMQQEAAEKQPYCFNLILGNLFRILAIFDRHSEKQFEQKGPVERSTAWKALQYIHMHFNKSGMDAALVAKKFNVTLLELGHILRKLTGQGFSENLHEVRIRNACAMMFFEELSTAFIAHYIGYSSLATFYRTFKKIKGITPREYRDGMIADAPIGAHRDTAWKILVYLLEHYTEEVKPRILAEHFFMGEDTIAQICMVNFGISLAELIEQIRLTYACALLAVKQLQIYDIAMAVGFNSMRTFSRCFKQNLGTTPLGYRKSLRLVE